MIVAGRPLSVLICLLPFRRIGWRPKLFVSWVGLRGAAPIIFATYPVVADVPGASQIFNIVFFVTLLSLILQGTTVIAAAKRLHLVDESASAKMISEWSLPRNIPPPCRLLLSHRRILKKGIRLAA